MDLETLLNIPPWDWPSDAGKMFGKVLLDQRAFESDRLIAAELAGDITVIDDDLAHILLTIANNPDEPDQLRSKAAISLGPILELANADGFEDADEVSVTEGMFRTIQQSLKKLYLDDIAPKEVRRRALEASVRAPEAWHLDAIRTSYSSEDKEWMLTAVFSMRWVRGFHDQILLALKSNDPLIHREAVEAAGNWELDAAWPHIVELLNDSQTPKLLLLTAIGAAARIRPTEAGEILVDLAESDDEEIAEAVEDAMSEAEMASGEEDDEEDDEWIN